MLHLIYYLQLLLINIPLLLVSENLNFEFYENAVSRYIAFQKTINIDFSDYY